MPQRPIRVRSRRSTIGLDYGTHSTKAVYRVRGEELGEVLYLDDETEGYPCNAAPSSIRLMDGRLYFGKEALSLSDGVYYGSLKADLYNASNQSVEVQEEIFVLTAAYLCWALARLFESYPKIAAENPILQISAPTSHTGPEQLVQTYLRIANAVHQVTLRQKRQFVRGVRFDEVREVLLPLLDEPIPSQEDRRFFVRPETVAPIVSLQMEPFLEPGNYLIADMGASTTEMSVFLVNDDNGHSAANSILCYSDSTEFRGGNELEKIMDMLVGESESALESFLDAMRRQANRVWHTAYKLDHGNPATHKRWQKLQIRLTGGGTHSVPVAKHFDEVINPIHAWPATMTKLTLDRHSPKTLECPRCDEPDLSFFAVANGLSVEAGRWPQFHSDASQLVAHATDAPLAPSYLEIG